MHKRCTAADKVSREAVKLVATIFGRLHSFRGSKIIFVIYKKKKNIKTKTQTKKIITKIKATSITKQRTPMAASNTVFMVVLREQQQQTYKQKACSRAG